MPRLYCVHTSWARAVMVEQSPVNPALAILRQKSLLGDAGAPGAPTSAPTIAADRTVILASTAIVSPFYRDYSLCDQRYAGSRAFRDTGVIGMRSEEHRSGGPWVCLSRR